MKEIWRITYNRDRFLEEDLKEIEKIWKDNPYNKIAYAGIVKDKFKEWAKQQGAIEIEDDFFCMKVVENSVEN